MFKWLSSLFKFDSFKNSNMIKNDSYYYFYLISAIIIYYKTINFFIPSEIETLGEAYDLGFFFKNLINLNIIYLLHFYINGLHFLPDLIYNGLSVIFIPKFSSLYMMFNFNIDKIISFLGAIDKGIIGVLL